MSDKPMIFSNVTDHQLIDERYAGPKIIYSGELIPPLDFDIGKIIRSHIYILSNITPDVTQARPIVLVRTSVAYSPAPSSTESKMAATLQYDALEKQLSYIGSSENNLPSVEEGAIRTAKEVIGHIRAASLAPPALSSLGSEALVMLWVLGNTKYAITITDGEIGYVVRKARETIVRKSDLKVSDLDMLLLEGQR